RPLRRAVTRFLENPLSKGILSGEFNSGDHILVNAGTDALLLTKVGGGASNTPDGDPESAPDEAVTAAN
nr:hypothetical protein [Chloroflexota bacterium]